MHQLIKFAAPAVLLSLCSACDTRTATQDVKPEPPSAGDRLDLTELFNPFYLGENLDQICIVDVLTAPLGEKEFDEAIDRIVADTGNGIAYSNPVRRNRIVYGAPLNCSDCEQSSAHSPAEYFDHIISVTTTNANEHPHVVESFDYMQELVADLENAAIAANFDFGPFVSREVMDKQAADGFCMLNSNLRAKQRYGLPFTYIHIWNNAILYVYNTESIDEELVPFLVERGLRECEADYDYEVRALTKVQARELKTITIEPPYTYRFE